MRRGVLFVAFAVLFSRAAFARGLTPEEARAVGPEMAGYPVADVVRLWPDLAPGEKTAVTGTYADDPNPERRIRSVYRNSTMPELMLFRPKERRSDAFLLICAGGSYEKICCNEIAKGALEYLARGYMCGVLMYRVPRPQDGRPYYLPALQDARQAIAHVRANAKRYGVDPKKIGILGFSAGGNLAVRTAVDASVAGDRSGTPDFVVAVYPAYLDGPDGKLCGELNVTKDAPPMCIVQGDLDGTWVLGSVALYAELHRQNVPAQLVVYGQCGHGLGERWPTVIHWNRLAADWVKLMGF